jgi:general secretion pathway protein J
VSRRSHGFTLVEMLAVIFLIGVVVASVVNFYLEMSRQSNAAADTTRVARRGTGALDRIARELEAALLVVRPGEVDPLDHPWVFFAEDRDGAEGADRLRFVTWSHRPRAGALRESDMAVVTYGLHEVDGVRSLMRWSAARLPDGLERDVPVAPEDGAQVLLEGVADFGLRFLGESGEWTERWDSSALVESNLLPVAAEIHLALEESDPEMAPTRLERQVLLALRPLDLQVLLAPDDDEGPGAGEGDEDDEQTSADCITVDQCRAQHPEIDLSGVDPTVLESVGSQCASEVTAFFSVPEDCL